jgi:hypothetical protein
MARPLRLVALAAVIALAALVTGCGDKESAYHLAKTEGPYLQAGPLTYQIQLSRELNARQPYDEQILHGLPANEQKLRKGEVWFGIWLRAENQTKQPELSAVNFDIRDTLGNTFDPMTFTPGVNSLIYKPTLLRAGGLLPNSETIQGQGGPRGQIIVFKLKTSAYQNRPLIFTIQPATGEPAKVELDL